MSTVKLNRINVALLKKHLRSKLLSEIDRASVEELKTWRSGQKRKNGEGPISPATVNRCLTTRIYISSPQAQDEEPRDIAYLIAAERA
jgi:hypothetical protein